MINLRPTFLSIGVVVALLTPALAQRATPEQMGQIGQRADYSTLHMQSNLGSFKILGGQGRCELTCTGTVLVSGLEGEVEASPGMKVEYVGMGRTVYHGSGQLVVTGTWRALQWFGTDMTGLWYGRGVVRIVGEFDRDLNTGTYWYSDPDDRGNWPTSMMELRLPELRIGVAEGVVPRRRGGGGN
ncbi:MAG: hypothetical protein IH945_00880 [Armatimonadetes bacterium]|nr:hypothetical protein [Armatimonadota bacterium]